MNFYSEMMQFSATIVCFLGFLCSVYNAPAGQDEWKNLQKLNGLPLAAKPRISRRYCERLPGYKSLCAMVTMNVRKDYMRLRLDSEIGFPELSEPKLPKIQTGYCIYCEYHECTFNVDRVYNGGKCFEGKAVLPLVKCKKSERTVTEDRNITVPYDVCQIR